MERGVFEIDQPEAVLVGGLFWVQRHGLLKGGEPQRRSPVAKMGETHLVGRAGLELPDLSLFCRGAPREEEAQETQKG